MNKQKYLDKVYKKQMYNASIFKKIVMICPNDQYKIVLNKVLDTVLINDYIAPLIEYYDEGYLIKPVNKLNLKKFVTEVDIIIINSSMQILNLKEFAYNQTLDFGFDLNSVIILPHGFIRLTKLKVGDKIKFKTLIKI